jgi:exopolyphosphatase/guanosine-5'-triphosphate,3'-diphosphate pyrophosphatase
VQSLLPHETKGAEAGKDPISTSLQLVGTAGTATTLAAMYLEMREYQPQRINGLVLTDHWLWDMTDRLLRSPLALRGRIPGLEAGREDIIAAGALIVGEILKGLHQPQMTISDAGLLEGLLLDHIEKEYGRPETLVSPLTWGTQRVKGLTKTEI